MRHREGNLDRAFFSVRFSYVLKGLGYATLRRWPLHGVEGLAGSEAAFWLKRAS